MLNLFVPQTATSQLLLSLIYFCGRVSSCFCLFCFRPSKGSTSHPQPFSTYAPPFIVFLSAFCLTFQFVSLTTSQTSHSSSNVNLFFWRQCCLFLSLLCCPLSFSTSEFMKIFLCVEWDWGDWLTVLGWEKGPLCEEVVEMTLLWGNTVNCVKIFSSPCLLNGCHSPANCFEAKTINPQWDLVPFIELAWSYRNISLLSIFEGGNMSSHPLPFLPQSVWVSYVFIFCHIKAFLSKSSHWATGKGTMWQRLGGFTLCHKT